MPRRLSQNESRVRGKQAQARIGLGDGNHLPAATGRACRLSREVDEQAVSDRRDNNQDEQARQSYNATTARAAQPLISDTCCSG